MKLLNYRNPGRVWRVYGRSVLRYSSPRKIINALRTEYAYRTRADQVPSMPFVLFLEPLYYCNLDCPLCDRQIFPDVRHGKEAGKLSLELYDRILDEVGDYLYQCQIYGQGEPLLDWARTRQIIEKSHRRQIFTLMSTNCTLVKPKVAEEVVGSGLDHVVCAIDGLTQESYERYRTGGCVEDAMDGMRRFVEEKRRQRSRIEIEWQFLVHRYNVHEMDLAQSIADDLGIFIRFAPLRGMEFHTHLQDYWLPEDGKSFQDGRLDLGETNSQYPCYFLWRSLVLNSNGKLGRCLIYQNVAEYCSLENLSVREGYNHPSVVRARQLFRKGPVPPGEFPSPCNNCSFYGREHGGPNMDKHSSLHRPPPPESLGTFVPSASLYRKREAVAETAKV
jgi:MoaA/NifB/PqqE/SkfB family radical SAM enzyme